MIILAIFASIYLIGFFTINELVWYFEKIAFNKRGEDYLIGYPSLKVYYTFIGILWILSILVIPTLIISILIIKFVDTFGPCMIKLYDISKVNNLFNYIGRFISTRQGF